MARGRPPKPTRLKIIQGNPGGRPLNESEPAPTGELVCPPNVTGIAREEWDIQAAWLKATGMAGLTDSAMLAAYCQAYKRWYEAGQVIDALGMTYETGKGYICQRPEVAIERNAGKQMQAIAGEFGLTPSSRVRLHTPAKTPTNDKGSRFFGT